VSHVCFPFRLIFGSQKFHQNFLNKESSSVLLA
jgi:hypothetical protein